MPVDPEDMHTFFSMNFEGLYPFTHHSAVMEMFNALMEDGLKDEAMEIRAYILENSRIPSVALFTNQIVYCARAGEAKLAIEQYHQMIRCWVAPNAYTYSILIKALAADPNFIGDAKKYLLEMMDKGMRPNARTYTAVLEAFALAGKAEECREILEQMRAKGIVVDEKVVSSFRRIRGALRNVMNALFGK